MAVISHLRIVAVESEGGDESRHASRCARQVHKTRPGREHGADGDRTGVERVRSVCRTVRLVARHVNVDVRGIRKDNLRRHRSLVSVNAHGNQLRRGQEKAIAQDNIKAKRQARIDLEDTRRTNKETGKFNSRIEEPARGWRVAEGDHGGNERLATTRRLAGQGRTNERLGENRISFRGNLSVTVT